MTDSVNITKISCWTFSRHCISDANKFNYLCYTYCKATDTSVCENWVCI